MTSIDAGSAKGTTYKEAECSGTELCPTGGYLTVGLEKIGPEVLSDCSTENVHHTTILGGEAVSECSIDPIETTLLSGVTLTASISEEYDPTIVGASYSFYTTVLVSANSANTSDSD